MKRGRGETEWERHSGDAEEERPKGRDRREDTERTRQRGRDSGKDKGR
jgi:hypothetical protein